VSHPRIAPKRIGGLRLEPLRTYPLRYGLAVLKHLKGRRPLRLEDVGVSVETDFELPTGRYHRWLALFGYEPAASPSPGAQPLFSFNSVADTAAIFALARRLGLPLHRVLHASTATRRLGAVEPGGHYVAESTYVGAEPRRNHSALVRFESRIKNPAGDVVAETDNAMFVAKIDPERWEMLNHNGQATPIRRKHRKLTAPDWSHDQLIDHRLGRRFGFLSGDLNPLHTAPWLAKLTGHRTGFIQGMCAYNLTVAGLSRYRADPLASLDMTFSRPFYVGAVATLHAQGDRFEWVDSEGKVLGYGTYATAPTEIPVEAAVPPERRRLPRTRERRTRFPTIDPVLGV